MRYMRVLVLSFMVTTIAPLPDPAQTKSQDKAARAKLEEATLANRAGVAKG